VAQLIKENMYLIKRWYDEPEVLAREATSGEVAVADDDDLDQLMRDVSVDPARTRKVTPTTTFQSSSSSLTVEPLNMDIQPTYSSYHTHGHRTHVQPSAPVPEEPSASLAEDEDVEDVEEDEVDQVALTSGATMSVTPASIDEPIAEAPVDADDSAVPDFAEVAKAEREERNKAWEDAERRQEEQDVSISEEDEVVATPSPDAYQLSPDTSSGIVRTENAFEHGQKLWQQAWGGATPAPVAEDADPAADLAAAEGEADEEADVDSTDAQSRLDAMMSADSAPKHAKHSKHTRTSKTSRSAHSKAAKAMPVATEVPAEPSNNDEVKMLLEQYKDEQSVEVAAEAALGAPQSGVQQPKQATTREVRQATTAPRRSPWYTVRQAPRQWTGARLGAAQGLGKAAAPTPFALMGAAAAVVVVVVGAVATMRARRAVESTRVERLPLLKSEEQV